jgi:hypothetical protein
MTMIFDAAQRTGRGNSWPLTRPGMVRQHRRGDERLTLDPPPDREQSGMVQPGADDLEIPAPGLTASHGSDPMNTADKQSITSRIYGDADTTNPLRRSAATRRRVLAGAAALTALALPARVAATPAFAASGSTFQMSDPLIALIARRAELYELAKPYWAKTTALETRIEQLETLSGHTMQSAYDAVSEEYEAAVEERSEVAEAPIWAIEKEIAETPAITMQGAIAKAQFMVDYLAVYELDFDRETNPFEWEMDTVRFIGVQLALDIDRLAGGAS